MGPLVLDSLATGLYEGKELNQKITVAIGWTIINFEICLKGLDAWLQLTRSLTVQLNRPVSGTCSFLNTQSLVLDSLATCLYEGKDYTKKLQ